MSKIYDQGPILRPRPCCGVIQIVLIILLLLVLLSPPFWIFSLCGLLRQARRRNFFRHHRYQKLERALPLQPQNNTRMTGNANYASGRYLSSYCCVVVGRLLSPRTSPKLKSLAVMKDPLVGTMHCVHSLPTSVSPTMSVNQHVIMEAFYRCCYNHELLLDSDC